MRRSAAWHAAWWSVVGCFVLVVHMKTDEELKAGWADFSNKMPQLVQQGSMQSTFVFCRVDTLPDGGMVTHMLAYNLNEATHLGLVAYQLASLHQKLHQHPEGVFTEYKHNSSRVMNLFNKLFGGKQDIANKKDLN